jgi:serine/threonine-protein kinase HipA
VTRRLAVVLYGRHAADLDQTPGGQHTLAYTDDPGSTPLSLSLPLVGGRHRHQAVEPYLEGLLPDRSDVRETIARTWGVSPRNPFALLGAIGLDCAGGVQFCAPGELDAVLARRGALEPVSHDAIADRLRQLRDDPGTSWVAPAERWSLAGAQAKFALRRLTDGGWAEARGSEPTTHIVKPGVTGFRLQALNEHICLVAARRLGLAAVRTEYVEFAGEPAVVVTRYDRRQVGGDWTRLHQEDLCQALAIYPARKYESDRGPGAVTIAKLLLASGRVEDRRRNADRFVEQLAFNYLIGAPDAHAKNYSILLVGPAVQLAPLYDVASGLPYDARRQTGLRDAAMAIGGVRRFGEVRAHHWAAFATAAGLDADHVVATVRDLATRLPAALGEALSDPAADPWAAELRDRLLAPVEALCERSLV